MQKSFKDMATRADNAVTQWRDMLGNMGFTQTEADRILSVYVREHIAKLDYGVGRYNVKHGAFLDAAVMRRALNV